MVLGAPRERVTIAVVIALVTGLLAVPSSAAAAARRPPDVLLIVTDDQRADTWTWMPTVVRRVVDRGRRYPRAAVPTTACCPSRTSLLTGQYSHTTGVWSNGRNAEILGTGGWPVFSGSGVEERTLAVSLAAAGYRPVLVGKYINGFDRAPQAYVPPGWLGWHAFAGNNGAYYGYSLRHADGSITDHGYEEGDYSTDVLRKLALQEIRGTRRRRPLFLMFNPFGVHGRHPTPAPRHVGSATVGAPQSPAINEHDMVDKPPWMQDLRTLGMPQVTRKSRTTEETLASVDEAVGAMIGAFERHRRLRNTLVIVTSDHGQLWGEHRLQGKYMPYEAASRVPLAIRWDREVERRGVDRRLALNIDVAATIADAAGVPMPDIDGRSLFEPAARQGYVLEAGATNGHDGNGQSVARPAYCGYHTSRFWFARYADGTEELYDLRLDPWELRNLAGDAGYSARTAKLRVKAESACRPTPPGFEW
jgi:arylsulfatase A-like enzyme